MKPKRYPYSGQKKKESTFKTIDVMMDDYFVESIRNNRLAQIYGLEKEGN
ncbi:hypothetical protein [Streptococcus lutetiensis]|nr:hypothetical protein [Streptococcus lutetiensis]MBT0889269.1 hypothetical protein [Streptococcus lutetiensis]MBT0914168.1 hypothetical protein [Streptococcus lutetiensis]MBT0915858.1 hypothetical protein [Streptococcus lutetiensis]MBT0919273.1 hypothetical protein [Streptococcus lutetiensis]MBT0920958.1 hypothetical protein [Streptococcus lutetiensis]